MFGDLTFTIICMAYFLGGLTIGYYAKGWKNRNGHKTGTGRWDWSKKDESKDGDYFR